MIDTSLPHSNGGRHSHSHHSKLKHRHDSFNGADLKVYVRDVSDKDGKKRAITVKTWSTVKDVKDALQKLLNVPPAAQKIYFGPLSTSGQDLPNHRSLTDAGIYRNGEVLYLEIKGYLPSSTSSGIGASNDLSTLKAQDNDLCISKAFLSVTNRDLKSIVKNTRIAITLGLKPSLVLDGSGGTYFLHDPNKRKIAVFKPADEEPYAENNPRGYVQQSYDQFEEADSLSMRAGIKPGEACLREVAAYLLDDKGFSGVPMTTLIEARHPAFNYYGSMLNLNQGGAAVGSHSLTIGSSPLLQQSSQTLQKKVGSCQEFVSSECSMDDLSPSKISVEEVHKIAVLDIRIMNADRNSANLLCRRKPNDPDTFELIPIDHGYCLRTVADVCWFDWCWLDWPQLKKSVSQKTKEYILNLDVEKDARMLKEKLNIPSDALDYFRASSKLLQAGIRVGMTLYDIAVLCCRNDDAGEHPSKLEQLLSMTAEIASSAVDNGRWHHAAASQALEQQLSETGLFSSSTFAPISKRNTISIFKSASSVNFSSFMSELSESEPLSDKQPLAPMFQTSCSDSSSDGVGDKEEEEAECEKWAADFIAGTLDYATTPIASPKTTRQRSISFARSDSLDESQDSSSELSRSPQGFWFVPPSQSKSATFHDEETTWSPESSPASSPNLLKSKNAVDFDKFRLHERSVKFELNPSCDKNDYEDTDSRTEPLTILSDSNAGSKSRSVQFDTTSLIAPDLSDQHDGINQSLDHDDIFGIFDIPHEPTFNMKRSQSYSGFSFNRIGSNSGQDSNAARASPLTTSSEEYKKYYAKFIDLLIDREIAAVLRTREIKKLNNANRFQPIDQ